MCNAGKTAANFALFGVVLLPDNADEASQSFCLEAFATFSLAVVSNCSLLPWEEFCWKMVVNLEEVLLFPLRLRHRFTTSYNGNHWACYWGGVLPIHSRISEIWQWFANFCFLVVYPLIANVLQAILTFQPSQKNLRPLHVCQLIFVFVCFSSFFFSRHFFSQPLVFVQRAAVFLFLSLLCCDFHDSFSPIP